MVDRRSIAHHAVTYLVAYVQYINILMAPRPSTQVCKIFVTFITLYYRFKTLASQSKDELVSLGFPSFTIEDFHQVVSSILIAFPFIAYQCSRRDGCEVISTFKADRVTFFMGTHCDVFFDETVYPQGVFKTQNGAMVSLNSFLDSLSSAQVSLNIIDWKLVSS